MRAFFCRLPAAILAGKVVFKIISTREAQTIYPFIEGKRIGKMKKANNVERLIY